MAEKIRAISMSRYRGGAAERRLYGGQGTITEFWVYFGDDPEPVKMRGHGATPGQRKTDAIERAKAVRGKTMQKNNPVSIEDAAVVERLYRKYVGRGSVDIDRLYRVIKDEKRAAESGTIKVSSGLVTELRNDLATVGRVRNSGYTSYANPDDVAPDAGPVAWFAIGVLAVAGGVIWYATRPGEAKASPTVPGVPAPAKKCASYDAVAKFAKNIGYNVWYVEAQAVATWQPAKPAYSSDPKARAYSQVDCSFFKWTGTAWVADDATNAELAAWVKSSTVGHPVSAFLP